MREEETLLENVIKKDWGPMDVHNMSEYLERCSSMRWSSCVLLDCEVLRDERLSEWVMFSMLPTTEGEGRLVAADTTPAGPNAQY